MKYEKPKVINLSSRAALGGSAVPDSCTTGVEATSGLCQPGGSAADYCQVGSNAGSGGGVCSTGTTGLPDITGCGSGASYQ